MKRSRQDIIEALRILGSGWEVQSRLPTLSDEKRAAYRECADELKESLDVLEGDMQKEGTKG